MYFAALASLMLVVMYFFIDYMRIPMMLFYTFGAIPGSIHTFGPYLKASGQQWRDTMAIFGREYSFARVTDASWE